MLPLVTIGIPTYNQAHTIKEAVQSALAQTYSNLEVVVADDSSPDATKKSIESLLSDPRLHYYKNETNKGRVGNYKKLLYEYASGDWYLNLDGDDYLTDPTFIDKAINEVLANQNVVLVQALASVEDKNGLPKNTLTSNTGTIELLEGTKFLLHYPEQYRIHHLGALYDRHKAMELDFYRSNTLRSDSESLLRLALRGKVLYYHYPVGVWRDNGNNETWLLNKEMLPKEKAVFDAVASDAVQKIDAATVRRWNRKVKEHIDLYFIDTFLSRRSFRHFPDVLNFAHPKMTFVKVFIKHFLHSFKSK